MGPARRTTNERGIRSQTSGAPGARRPRAATAAAPPSAGASRGTARAARDRARRPAAAPPPRLRLEDTTLLGRLLGQLADLGIREVARDHAPGLGRARSSRPTRAAAWRVRLHACADARRRPARRRRRSRAPAPAPMVVANADILTQREALAGLLADPRVATGMLTTTVRRVYRYVGFRTRTRRGRVVSAGSPYHYVHGANGTFLGVLKVAPGRPRARSPTSPARLAALVDGAAARRLAGGARRQGGPLEAGAVPPRAARARRARRGASSRPTRRCDAADDSGLRPSDVELVARGRRPSSSAASPPPRGDVPSLLLCGLVRAAGPVGVSAPAAACSGRARSPTRTSRARPSGSARHDEDRALLDSAVKANDGFFTTFFVSPVLEVHRALGRAPRLDAQRRHHAVGGDRLRRRRGVRHRRPLGDDRRRDPAPARVHVRLRRRPARALHAHVHQARRVAGLDLRPHQGVRGLRRPRDRRAARATTSGCSPARRWRCR